VAAAVTTLAVLVILCAVGGLVWLLGAFFRSFSNVFLPLAAAAIVALVTKPYYDLLRRRLAPLLAVAVVFLSIILPIAAFAWFFGALAVGQVSDLVDHLPEWGRRLSAWASDHWPRVRELLDQYDVAARLQAALEGKGEILVGVLQGLGGKAMAAGAGILHVVVALFGWAVFPVYVAFILMSDLGDVGRLDGLLPFLKPETRRDAVYLARQFVGILVAFFRGQILIAFLQGVLYATGFSLVGLRYGLVLGLLLGFLNVIPYLGSIVGLSIAFPLAFFQDGGGLWKVGAVAIVFVVVQLVESYVLTPKIMGDRTGLHPMAIIVAVFFWGAALGGILGMILAIPLTAFLVVFWRLAREHYIQAIV